MVVKTNIRCCVRSYVTSLLGIMLGVGAAKNVWMSDKQRVFVNKHVRCCDKCRLFGDNQGLFAR